MVMSFDTSRLSTQISTLLNSRGSRECFKKRTNQQHPVSFIQFSCHLLLHTLPAAPYLFDDHNVSHKTLFKRETVFKSEIFSR